MSQEANNTVEKQWNLATFAADLHSHCGAYAYAPRDSQLLLGEEQTNAQLHADKAFDALVKLCAEAMQQCNHPGCAVDMMRDVLRNNHIDAGEVLGEILIREHTGYTVLYMLTSTREQVTQQAAGLTEGLI